MRLLLALLCGCWTSSTPIVENPIERRFVKKQRATCAKLETHAGWLPKPPDYHAVCDRPDEVDEMHCKYVEAAWYATMLRWWADRAIAECLPILPPNS